MSGVNLAPYGQDHGKFHVDYESDRDGVKLLYWPGAFSRNIYPRKVTLHVDTLEDAENMIATILNAEVEGRPASSLVAAENAARAAAHRTLFFTGQVKDMRSIVLDAQRHGLANDPAAVESVFEALLDIANRERPDFRETHVPEPR